MDSFLSHSLFTTHVTHQFTPKAPKGLCVKQSKFLLYSGFVTSYFVEIPIIENEKTLAKVIVLRAFEIHTPECN